MPSAGDQQRKLVPAQRHALLDILTHHETYTEVEGFKWPTTVASYGFPFQSTTPAGVAAVGADGGTTDTPWTTAPNTPRLRTPVPPDDGEEEEGGVVPPEESTSPLLQTLLTRFVLPLPGVNGLPRSFWAVRVQGLLARLGEAELSESYDKGALGLRKTLATGASAVIEMLGRGAFAGLERREPATADDGGIKLRVYDRSSAEDLEKAWDDLVDGIVYGDLVDEAFDHMVKTDDLEGHSPAAKVAAEYSIIHLATFVHHIFVLSPEGQYLLKLMENVHNLIPYKMLKQTLRVGNAATMISGMMRLLLAKLSVTSLTNWFGLTQNADDGMNLLQRIISLVLSWDSSEFKKSAERVERGKDKPDDEMLQAIKAFMAEGREKHEAARAASQEQEQSIIVAILNAENPTLASKLTDGQHEQCLEYYSALLSVRDREAITTAFCRQPPDLFTQMLKDGVGAYEPIIRTVHSCIDLREHLDAAQQFVDDFIKTSRPKKGSQQQMASVEDYVELLMRNRGLVYKWIHALAEKCPDVWGEFRVWAKDAMVRFQQHGTDESATDDKTPSSNMDKQLDDLFASTSSSSQEAMLAAIDAHAEYLETMTQISRARLQYLITTVDSGGAAGGAMAGPGVYLARWQHLLDETRITPAQPQGAVRCGSDVKHAVTMGKTGITGAEAAEKETQNPVAEEGLKAPDVSVVVRELGTGFRDIVRKNGARDDSAAVVLQSSAGGGP